ncbi:MAG: DUF4131 domain-containing protein, partial [Gammaproteobacteria bacterium]|nr:DUF4131 domain-containing protein [Gammaproteobacteria bacterium]
MLGLAFPALAGAWLLQYFDTRVLLALPALGWPLAILLAWYIGGRRVAVVVLVCGWTLLRAGWLIESRLPEVLAGEDVLVRGVICDFPRGDLQAQRFVLVTEAEQGSPWLPARLQLSWYEQAPALAPGEIVDPDVVGHVADVHGHPSTIVREVERPICGGWSIQVLGV